MFRSATAIRTATLLIALAALGAQTARPDVLYFDYFTPTPENPCWRFTFPWDLDHDDSLDFCFQAPCCDCMSCCTANLEAVPGGGVVPDSVARDTLIRPELNWGSGVEWSFCADGCGGGPGCGNPGVPVFLGLRFVAADGTHYAWLRVLYMGDFDLALVDYAYETDPDTPILAGAGYPSEPGDLNCYGSVNFGDINAFVALLGNG